MLNRLAVVFALCLVPCSTAFAQTKADGKWYFPDSVRAMCIDTEQGLVAQFKALIEKNRDWLDPTSTSDKSDFRQITDAMKQAIKEREITWERLGCVHILYGLDKSGNVRK